MKFYADRFKKTKNRKYCISLFFPFVRADKKNKRLILTSLIKYRFDEKIAAADLRMKIGGVPHKVRIITPFSDRKKPGRKGFGIMRICVKQSELNDFRKNNFVNLNYKGKAKSMMFHGLARSYRKRASRALYDRENNTMAYFKEASNGKLMLTIRGISETDKLSNRIKIRLAYIAAKAADIFVRKRPILMYEKFGRYEEGASILFEKLMDEKYTDVYYAANDVLLPQGVKEKYGSNIVSQYSFKHYYTYFRAHTFIATEQIMRAVDLDSPSFLIWKHCRQGHDKITHVHLQHGVMYMLSLSSAERSNSRNSAKEAFYRQVYVVSSEKEARHFTELGEYSREDLYLTGIPKFDRAFQYNNPDKVVIMPTWRPWEDNVAIHAPEKSTYYAFMQKLIKAVPEELEDKLIVLPHPLFNRLFRREDKSDYNKSYDEILRETKVLITDYSSISYDAFYRGANIIFDWSEKDYCMEKYGEGSYLMLSEADTFGDICHSEEELHDAIIRQYTAPQKQEYIDNFNTIVEFHDNRNCERVIDCLKKDGLLK